MDPAVFFFFLLSPLCLEKHKDFDIWAAKRGGNKTSAHSEHVSEYHILFHGLFLPALSANSPYVQRGSVAEN